MIGILFFCVGMVYFLTLILLAELRLFVRIALREAREGLMLFDTDVFPDVCINPFPNFAPPP